MRDHELFMAAAAFIEADVKYVQLVERAVDFNGKGKPGISDRELESLRGAKAQRAVLEDQMYAQLELSRLGDELSAGAKRIGPRPRPAATISLQMRQRIKRNGHEP